MSINWADLAREEGFFDDPDTPPVVKLVVPRKDARSRAQKVIFDHKNNKLFAGKFRKEFRRSLTYPDYYISKDGVVKNVDGQTLRNRVTSSDSQVSLRIGIKNRNVYKHILLHEAWPELAPEYRRNHFIFEDEAWKHIEEFPGYAVSTSGRVMRMKNFTMLTNRSGRVYMSRDGKQFSRSARKLVFSEFKHEPGEVKYLKEFKGYAISRDARIYSLRTMEEIKQFRGGAYGRDGESRLYFPVKDLMKEYFVD